MRILHIMAGRHRSGAETYATDVILHLHAQGVDQCAVVPDQTLCADALSKAGIRNAPDVLSFPLRFVQRQRLKKIIQQEKPDIIHCWMRRAAQLVPEDTGQPVVGWFSRYSNPVHFKNCSHFIGATKDLLAHQVRKGVRPDRVCLIPTFPVLGDERPVDRGSLATPMGAPLLLSMARLHPDKGVDVLLQAVSQMPDVYLWIAGEGPTRDGLEKLARKLGIEKRVRFLGWRTDRGALLRAVDVCVLPSRVEPLGSVLPEAWACGTPLVATRTAAPLSHITDGHNGILVPVGDPTALAQAVHGVLNDDHLRRAIIAGGFETYSRHHTRKAVVDNLVKLYHEIIETKSK